MRKEINWLKRTKVRKPYLITAGIFLIPAVLYFLPFEWFDEKVNVCLVKNLFGINCYGCGTTRAILSAIHLEFEKAWHYNKMVIIVLPLLIFLWLKMLNGIPRSGEKGDLTTLEN